MCITNLKSLNLDKTVVLVIYSYIARCAQLSHAKSKCIATGVPYLSEWKPGFLFPINK